MNLTGECGGYCREVVRENYTQSYNNCDVAAALFAPWIQNDDLTISIPSLVEFLWMLQPADSEEPTPYFALSWFSCFLYCETFPTNIEEYFSKLGTTCKTEMCKNMTWEGNPDIAGIGTSSLNTSLSICS